MSGIFSWLKRAWNSGYPSFNAPCEAGEVVILDYGVNALVCHLEEGVNNVTTCALADYMDAFAKRNAIIAQNADFSREYRENLCDDIWGDLWQ